MLRVKKNALYR